MDRELVRAHLAQARRHVAQGERHISDQKALIEKLVGAGHNEMAEKARALLKQFEQLQNLHICDRNRLEARLAAFVTR